MRTAREDDPQVMATKKAVMPRRRGTGGFSLVELMVTVLILGLLLGSVLPAVDGMVRRAKNSALRQNALVVQKIAQGYAMDNNGEVPTSRQQMCSSPTFISIQNPYRPELKGMNAFFDFGSADCAQYDVSNSQGPLLIWPYQTSSWGSNPLFNGVVFYTPYNRLNGDCSSSFGAADNCFGIHYNGSSFMLYGGNANLQGYEYYIITAIGQDDRYVTQYRQVSNLELKNW